MDEDEIEEMKVALRDLAAIAWRINDTADLSDADRICFDSTNDWDDLNDVLHRHRATIARIEV